MMTAKQVNSAPTSPNMWIVYQHKFPHLVVTTAFCSLARVNHMI